MNKNHLRNKIIESLKFQGFKINPHVRPAAETKIAYRKLQSQSRTEQIILHKEFLKNNFKKIEPFLIDGKNLYPEKIQLELREVKSGSLEEIIFKWWNLVWWSVPYQRAYGRQMRFVLWDKGHNTPFGLIGLQSPILKMSTRDNYLEIPNKELDLWINKSMQAQRLGALPPYNMLIGGKMTALAMTSNELRKVYKDKYKGIKTILKERVIKSDLLFITTSSAFGRSSIYNRLKYKDELAAISLGFTKGSGSFHIPEALYKEILFFLKKKGENGSTTFGTGPSRKIKLLDKAFRYLELPHYSYHNLKRELYLFPLVDNLKEVIKKKEKPLYHDRPIKELLEYWKERWCLGRARRTDEWKKVDSKEFLKRFMKQFKLNN